MRLPRHLRRRREEGCLWRSVATRCDGTVGVAGDRSARRARAAEILRRGMCSLHHYHWLLCCAVLRGRRDWGYRSPGGRVPTLGLTRTSGSKCDP